MTDKATLYQLLAIYIKQSRCRLIDASTVRAMGNADEIIHVIHIILILILILVIVLILGFSSSFFFLPSFCLCFVCVFFILFSPFFYPPLIFPQYHLHLIFLPLWRDGHVWRSGACPCACACVYPDEIFSKTTFIAIILSLLSPMYLASVIILLSVY